jgi:hypothetical protein
MEQETSTVVDRGQYADAVTPWEREEWRGAALGWVEREVVAGGLRPSGQRRVRVRPWSVLVRVGVEEGADVWFKANPPGSAFEAGLTAALAGWVPGEVLQPLAVDAGRGWSLLPDGGELFREALDRGDAGPRDWEQALGRYARVQRALGPYADRLEPLGVPAARTLELPAVFDGVLADNADNPHLTSEDRARLDALRPRLDDWCAELAALGIADSLDHADLHDGQLFRPEPGRFTFFDWGDAAVTHPFCSFAVPARRVRERYGPEALPRLADAYLDPWTDTGRSRTELRRALAVATRLGALHPVRAWGRLFPGTSVAARPEAVAEWLRGMCAGLPPVRGAGAEFPLP